MGWLASALLALLVLAAVAFLAPAIFGPVVAGAAPLLFVVALIGLGGIWWRHSRSRVDAASAAGDDAGEREAAELRGEDERVET